MESDKIEEVFFEPEKNGKSDDKFKSLLLSITVEPLVLFYIVPSTMNHVMTQNLLLDESCRDNLKYGDLVCKAIMKRDLTGYTNYQELEVHKLASKMMSIKTIVQGIIPVVIMLFLGSWSDKHSKRKPCILGPIIGELIAIAGLIVNVIFIHKIPIVLTALLYSLPMGISGGWPCYFLGVYSYATTSSNAQNLTTKIGCVSTVKNVATIIGIGLSGIVFNLLGFIGSYSTIFFMILSSLVYGYYIIEERKIIVEEAKEELQCIETKPKELLKDFFQVHHFKKTMKVCFSKGHHHRRMRIISTLFLLLIVNGPLEGEHSISFLYTKFKFGWSPLAFATFTAVQFLFQILGSIIALVLFVKYLKWEDETLGLISFFSSILAGITFACANDQIIFYAGAALDLFSGIAQIALRSLMSKIVFNHEIGKANSLFQICEAFTHLIFGTVYTILFSSALHLFPGSIFLLSVSLKIMGIFPFIWLYRQTIELKKISEKKNHEEDCTIRN